MDREILSRGKRLDNGEWVEGSYMEHYYSSRFGRVSAIFTNEDVLCKTYRIPVDPATVGRYTGLTDKNGVKIFEGDIVVAGYFEWKCQVVWDEQCARFICFTLEGERRIVYVSMVDKNGKSAIEVIGNVHDNPKLMGGEQ